MELPGLKELNSPYPITHVVCTKPLNDIANPQKRLELFDSSRCIALTLSDASPCTHMLAKELSESVQCAHVT